MLGGSGEGEDKGEGHAGWDGASGSDPGLDVGAAAPGTAAQTALLIPAPLHTLVQGPAARLEAHEEAKAPGQAAVGGHGHHDEGRHDDEAQDDEGRGAVVIQDGSAVAGSGVQHLWEHREFVTEQLVDRGRDQSSPGFQCLPNEARLLFPLQSSSDMI